MKQKDSVFTSSVVKIPHPGLSRPMTIIPVGDVHYTSPMHSTEGFATARKEWQHLDPETTWYIWTGDEHETTSHSERPVFEDGRIHESTLSKLDKVMADDCEELYEKCMFMKGHVLGMIQGNHFWVFQSECKKRGIVVGMTSTEYMCKLFETKWLGFLNYMRLSVDIQSAKTALDLVTAHGKAGGKLVGTPINQVNDLRTIFPAADIYTMGHDHTRGALPASCLQAPNGCSKGDFVIKQKRQWLGRSGCFLRGYVENEQNYPVKAMYRPTEIGYIKYETRFSRPNSKLGKSVMTVDTHCWA
jgi:hypothetical protein